MLYLRPELVALEQLEQPDALNAISKDCVEASAEYGKERFDAVLAGMVRTVREALRGR